MWKNNSFFYAVLSGVSILCYQRLRFKICKTNRSMKMKLNFNIGIAVTVTDTVKIIKLF